MIVLAATDGFLVVVVVVVIDIFWSALIKPSVCFRSAFCLLLVLVFILISY